MMTERKQMSISNKSKASEDRMVATKVSEEMHQEILKAMASGRFQTISEYLRWLVRGDLEARRRGLATGTDEQAA